ncbi:CaiB/BaiF CoA transferase family protein [Ralstonia sp. UBA689]|uniref:CaiB/BaiF CoA transferase family protein n=1 Tax=Ralstonia sp. UBA689 TaxID=1947373 RepID=UPI0025EDAB3D|nr:CoA transferase [Ralstonia sp. UBA689]
MIFEGLRVIDCSSFIAAPGAAAVLADFGADVIKIEPPGAGDPGRNLARLPGMPKGDVNYAWLLDNRSKRGLALDIAQPEGLAVLERLVREADVFITNLPLAVRNKLGISHDALSALNDRLVYASFTGYGEVGAEASKPGFDMTAWWARSGLMDGVRSDAESPPTRANTGMGDHSSAMALFAAIVTGLYERERTGRGTQVGSSLVANGLWSNGFMIQAALCGATIFPRPPRERLFNALTTYYRCKDDRWLILTILNEERQWPTLAKCLDIESLIDDSRFATQADRFKNSVELIAVLDAAFATRDRGEWRAILTAAGLVFEIVAELADVVEDRQAIDNGFLLPIENDTMMTVGSPFFVSSKPKTKPRKAPDVGQHSDEILREAGYDPSEIADLRAGCVVA